MARTHPMLQKSTHNESFKELGVNPEDKIAFEALLHSSQIEIQELRHKLKMPSSEHVQSNELA